MAKKPNKTDEYKPMAMRPTTHRRLKSMAEAARPHTSMIDLLEMIVEDAWHNYRMLSKLERSRKRKAKR